MKRPITKEELPILSGELALAINIIINSFAVVLMLYSGAGISAISSVPFAFSEVLPHLSLGTWTYLFQGLLVLILMFLQKRFVPQYLFSFVVGFLFGQLVDVHELWIHILPQTMFCRILYFIISYLLLSVGIALSNRCGLPIVPTDLFPREVSQISGIHYPRIKISFNLLFLLKRNIHPLIHMPYMQKDLEKYSRSFYYPLLKNLNIFDIRFFLFFLNHICICNFIFRKHCI